MIIFTKYSNDRRPELAIRTYIAETNGVKSVVKAAADPRAEAHISGLVKSYNGLREIFANTKFVLNHCEAGDGQCTFEFLQGDMLEEEMDALLGRPDELVAALREYFDELVSAADTEFVMTDEYAEVFGDITTSDKRAFSVGNIDMVLNNIIVRDGWNVIDYEWTFHFPVPVNFIIWRAYHYYVDVSMKRQGLLRYNIPESYGITWDDIEKFKQMEINFQKFVTGSKVALRDLYSEISPGYAVIGELLHSYREKHEKRMITIYLETDGHFTSAGMLTMFTDPRGSFKRTIRLLGARRLRFDPTEEAVAVHVNSVTAGEKCLELRQEDTNGVLLGDNDIIFIEEDPWFILTDIPEGTESLTIDMNVRPLDKDFVTAWQKMTCRLRDAEEQNAVLDRTIEQQNARIAALRRSARLSQDIIGERNRAIRELGETKVMRMYRKFRTGRKQADPVEGFCPRIVNDREPVLYSVDYVIAHNRYLMICGWAQDTMFDCEELSVVDASGREVPCSIFRVPREDVSASLNSDPERNPGFEICIRYSRLTALPLTLRIETPRGYIETPIEGVDPEDIKRGRDGEIEYEARAGFPMEYDDYVTSRRAPRERLKEQRKETFPYQPLVSFCIPLYSSSDRNLKKMVDSLLSQSYRNTEICLADGSGGAGLEAFIQEHYGTESRVNYIKVAENPLMAENLTEAIQLASGDVIIPADANDIADPQTAYEIVKFMNEEDADAVYTDEDSVSSDGFCFTQPKFKPDYSPDYLRSTNYIGRFFAVRRDVLKEAGMPDRNYGNTFMYDFILRCCEKSAKVAHVPMALCHVRINPLRYRKNPNDIEEEYRCEMRSIDAHLKRVGIEGKSEKTSVKGGYRVKARVIGRPLVSIIIPTKDHPETLRRAVDSIIGKSTYGNYEIIIIENGSVEERTFLYYERLKRKYPFIKILKWEEPFNYSAINNFGVREAEGDYLLFLNNDVEVITPEWIEEMLSICQRKDCGACGARLLFPNNTIQHMGVIIGLGGPAGHMFSGERADEVLYGGRGNLTQNVSAATAACLMMKRSVFEEAGGFDELLTVAFNDVDLCLKVRDLGYLVAVAAFAELRHYESLTRGSDRAGDNSEKYQRFLRESAVIRTRWEKYFRNGDPYYNPNFDTSRGILAFRGEYPKVNNQEDE